MKSSKPMNNIKAIFSALLIFSFLHVTAQVDYDKIGEVSSTFLIENVNVYSATGNLIENTSILIKDGRIKEIGKSIKKPFDAQLIEADSMYVYPGFIDGLSQIGLAKSDSEEKEGTIKFPGLPSDKQAGITPYASVEIDPKSNGLGDYRSAGFCAAHIVPKGTMIPGQGSIVSLTKSADVDPILKKDYSMFSQFKTKRGRYPSTVIGVIAKWKDLYRKATYKQTHLQNHQRNPLSSRPNIAPAEKGLLPVINKSQTVFFLTENHKDLSRAINLQQELGFNMAVVNLKQGWMSVKKLKSRNYPVLLSLDLPEDKKDKKKDEDEDDESKAFQERKAASLKSYLEQASQFEKANIQFGFTTFSSKPKDVQASLLRMKQHGASEKALINAMTINNAKILGLSSQIGSIEKNKMANLFITDKPYFEKDSKIKYTFVEGQKFEFKKAQKKDSKSGDAVVINGKWRYSGEVMGEAQNGVIIISGSDGNYELQMISDDEPNDPILANDVVKSGNNLTYNFNIEAGPGQTLRIDAELDFSGDTYQGSVAIEPFGTFPISGSKISNPE